MKMCYKKSTVLASKVGELEKIKCLKYINYNLYGIVDAEFGEKYGRNICSTAHDAVLGDVLLYK